MRTQEVEQNLKRTFTFITISVLDGWCNDAFRYLLPHTGLEKGLNFRLATWIAQVEGGHGFQHIFIGTGALIRDHILRQPSPSEPFNHMSLNYPPLAQDSPCAADKSLNMCVCVSNG
eukprot:1745133-Amphidinium_carterae.1